MSNKAKFFENLAQEQTRDPTMEYDEQTRPVPGAGWSHSGHSGGGHTGHDGKFKANKTETVVTVSKKPPPGKKSLADLP